MADICPVMHPASDLHRLRRLHHWLTLEGWAGVGGLAGFWLPAGPLAALLSAAAVGFTPVLVHALWTLGRRGWLLSFVVLVGGALVASLAMPGVWGALRWAPVLLAFYGYTWALKLAVAEWVRQAEEAVQWQAEKARWATDEIGLAG